MQNVEQQQQRAAAAAKQAGVAAVYEKDSTHTLHFARQLLLVWQKLTVYLPADDLLTHSVMRSATAAAARFAAATLTHIA